MATGLVAFLSGCVIAYLFLGHLAVNKLGDWQVEGYDYTTGFIRTVSLDYIVVSILNPFSADSTIPLRVKLYDGIPVRHYVSYKDGDGTISNTASIPMKTQELQPGQVVSIKFLQRVGDFHPSQLLVLDTVRL